MKSGIPLLMAIGLTLTACQSRRVTMPTIEVVGTPGGGPADDGAAPSAPYQAAATRKFDLLHTGLDVRFDWAKEELYGTATLRLKPWFHPVDRLVLDAKGFVIHKVELKSGAEWATLPHTYDLRQLDISLGRNYAQNEELEVRIAYTAQPGRLVELLGEEDGQERGLYFINPKGDDPSKPRQIWTQGETHGSSAWFPTIDHPNERCTQEMWITVDANFQTLSNGLLIDSRLNNDSGKATRTDHWQMKLPHAPYLFMMAVGEFSVTKDTWRGKEVSYYVEPEFAPHARMIFGNTPEMIEFFSNRLGVPYPWEKYSQVVVRDFVSGAMENTSATVHFSALQHDARQHLDETYEDYISHELFHQWFGDLVTCESWANLTLNEGFATYGEYLWKAYKYGQDEAEQHIEGDLRSYLGEAMRKQEPLIRYHHNSPDEMFDAHSYQKGGLVLHMLRYYLGDAMFFEGVKRYLTRHAYTEVEIDELRLIMEEVSGEDLNWFFDQWYLRPGHPALRITHSQEQGAWNVKVVQLQGGPAFRFPVRLDMVRDGQHESFQVWVESTDTTFRLPASTTPDNVVFDADKALLASITEQKPKAAWIAQLQSAENYRQKSQAIEQLESGPRDAAVDAAMLALLQDKHWGLRVRALGYLSAASRETAKDVAPSVVGLLQDPVAAVRRAALDFFAEQYFNLSDKLPKPLQDQAVAAFERATGDSSYRVQEGALRVLHLYDPAKGSARVKAMMPDVHPRMVPVVADILIEDEDPTVMPWITGRLAADRSAMGRSSMVRILGYARSKPKLKAEAIRLLQDIAATDDNWWIRYAAFRNLEESIDEEAVKEFFQTRLDAETNEMLQRYLKKALE